MAKELICTNCGYKGKPKKVTKGSIFIEIILWLTFIIPGVIYSIWRLTSQYEVCPQCGATNMIPLDSPDRKKLIIKDKVSRTDEVLARIPWKIGGEIRNSTVRNYIATNIEDGENIIATLLGIGEKTNIGAIFGRKAGSILGGDYLLVTDRKVVAIKTGVGVWATGGFGLKAKIFLYDHITSVDVSKGIFFGEIEIVTGGMVEKESGGFLSGASKDSVIQFEKEYFEEVQRLARKILELAQQSRESRSLPSSNDILGQIRKLAELRDAGIITEEEFLEKKRRLLDRI